MSQENHIEEKFIKALQGVKYPGFDADILSMDLVTSAVMEGSKAKISLRAIQAPPKVREEIENFIAQAVTGIEGVTELELDFPEPPPPAQDKPQAQEIPGVAAVVPVASGKGGVGKSTVAVNLAVGLSQLGLKVGILDLDLYGPSIPLMLGLVGKQPEAAENKLAPLEAHGIKIMSIGFMIPADRALIWRGPLIMKAVRQLLFDVAWAPLDVLIVDMPPGTGDVQISMTQDVPVTGAVVVTTPQDVALVDAVKGVDLFRQTNSPILGIVENMSYFQCPDCNSRHEIFGHGSVEPLCAKLGVDYLGELPLDPQVRAMADQGKPAVENGPDGQPYVELAKKVKAGLDKLTAAKGA